MRILGIDPGIAIVGWAVLDRQKTVVRLAHCGSIESPKTDSLQDRLVQIHAGLEQIIQEFKPDEAAMEELFFSTNVKTAITVAQARGVLLLALAQKNIPVTPYGPNVVKKIITGDGGADKRMVQTMITKILRIDKAPKPDDIADAVAIALTHAYQSR